MEAIIKMLEEIQDKYASRSLVLELSNRDVSDYDRGIIAGEIRMLTRIMTELANDKSKIF